MPHPLLYLAFKKMFGCSCKRCTPHYVFQCTVCAPVSGPMKFRQLTVSWLVCSHQLYTCSHPTYPRRYVSMSEVMSVLIVRKKKRIVIHWHLCYFQTHVFASLQQVSHSGKVESWHFPREIASWCKGHCRHWRKDVLIKKCRDCLGKGSHRECFAVLF